MAKRLEKKTYELVVTPQVLATRQAYPLDLKVAMSLERVRRWYERYAGDVYVAFSGGLDSTVLLHLVRSIYPQVPAVFVDTGLEYPEIRRFAGGKDNVTVLRPAMSFREVIARHGWPVISKRVADAVKRIRSPGSSERTRKKALYGDKRGDFGKLPAKWRFLLHAPFRISDRCCEIMKMRPIQKYYKRTGRAAYVGTMAADSNGRRQSYQKHGCYMPDLSVPRCTPLAFWRRDDIVEYLGTRRIDSCSIYAGGVRHTGCIYCCFGLHMESRPNRFDILKRTHPQLYRYCMYRLGLLHVIRFLRDNNAIPEETAHERKTA